jgi:hypothetical protein
VAFVSDVPREAREVPILKRIIEARDGCVASGATHRGGPLGETARRAHGLPHRIAFVAENLLDLRAIVIVSRDRPT